MKKNVNKTAIVAKALADNPSASPKELAATLTKQGIKMSPGYVSTIKSSLKRKGGANPTRVAAAPVDRGIPLSDLADAVAFASAHGGVGNVKRIFDVLVLVEDGIKK